MLRASQSLRALNRLAFLVVLMFFVLGALACSAAELSFNRLLPADTPRRPGMRVTEDVLFGWKVLGPMKLDKSLFAGDDAGEKTLAAEPHASLAEWNTTEPPPMEYRGKTWAWTDVVAPFRRIYVGYREVIPGGLMPPFSVQFLHTTITVPQRMEHVRVLFASDDYCQIFVAGKEVARYAGINRGVQRDDDKSEPFTLEPGRSSIVVKLVNHGGGAGFAMRFVDAEGHALPVTGPEDIEWSAQPVRNTLPNGSFELGQAHWMVFEDGAETRTEVVAEKTAPDGRNVLRISALGGTFPTRLATEWQRLDPMVGDYTLRLWARAPKGEVTLEAGVVPARGHKYHAVLPRGIFAIEKTVELTPDWQEIVVTGPLSLAPKDNFRVMMFARGQGDVEIDAVSLKLAEAEHEAAYQPAEPIELALHVEGATYGMLDGQKPFSLRLRAYAPEVQDRPDKASLRVTDIDGRVRLDKTVDLTWDAMGRGSARLDAPPMPIGYYTLSAEVPLAEGEPMKSEAALAVIESHLDDPLTKHGFFGLHSGRLARNPTLTARAMKMMGVEVVRLADFPMWNWIEPQKGQFDWTIPAFVQALVDQRVELIGHLVGIPDWAQKTRGARPGKAHARPPASYKTYRTAIAQIVNRYKDIIQTWEHWNEPDLRHNWVAGPEVYTDLLGQAAQAVLQADPEATITGANLCTPKWHWYERSIARGLFKHINAMGIHGYGTKTPEDWIDVIATMRKLQEQAGVEMPILVTEYGTTGGPPVDPRRSQYLRLTDAYKPPRVHAAELARI